MRLLHRATDRLLQVLLLGAFVCTAFASSSMAAEPSTASPSVRLAIAPITVESESKHAAFAEQLPKDLGRRLLRDSRVSLVPLNEVREKIRNFEGERLGTTELRALASELDAAFILVWRLYESPETLRLVAYIIPAQIESTLTKRLELSAENEEKLAAQVPKLAETILPLLFESEKNAEAAPPSDQTEATKPLPSPEVAPEPEVAPTPKVAPTPEVAPAPGVPPTTEPAPAPQPAAVPDSISEIRIRGNQRIEARAIRARMVTRVGDRIDPDHIARDIHSIYQLGFFRDVNIFQEPGPDGWILTVVVRENPVIREIAIKGNKKVESKEIKDVLTLTTGAVLDYTLLRENVARIESMYHTEGYYLAKISYTVQRIEEGFVSVDFEIVEGKKLRLRTIRFEGNKFFSDRELRKGLKTKPWHFWSYATSFITHAGTYSEPIFGQDLRDIAQRYSDEGYLRVEIGDPKVEITDKGIELVVQIDEGGRYKVGTINVAGDATVDIESIRKELKLKQGEVFNRSALTEDVEKLTAHYTDRGFYFANVSPRTDLKPGELVVDVSYEVEKGPLYFIRDIAFSGNTTTVDPVLLREMSLVEGELYSARSLEVSRKRLKGLGFFEEVDFEPKPTDVPGQLDLAVKVVERPTGSFSLGAGYSSQEGMIFTGSLSQSNLFGRGYGLRFSADIGNNANRYYISFSNPYAFGTEFSLVSTVFNSEVNYEDFRQSQQGFNIVVGHPLNEERTARGYLGYGLSDLEIDQSSVGVTAAASILRARYLGSKVTSSLTLSYSDNTLNDFLAPTDGAQINGSLEYAGLGGFSQFARVESQVRYFIPAPRWMLRGSTFMVGGGVGYAQPFNDISDWDVPELSPAEQAFLFDNQDNPSVNLAEIGQLDQIDDDLTLPLSERFFLGGLGRYQLRGYKARSVGPRRAILKPLIYTGTNQSGALYTTYDRNPDGTCPAGADDKCNSLNDRYDDDFANLKYTDVIGGNKFISLTTEYRFPISEAMGLVGILFIDGGNAFAEGDNNLFDVGVWRYGTGLGIQWFSPFGPLQAFYGIPINKTEVDDASVFEFSMGGQGF